MKHTLIFETQLSCDVKTLFDFHADTTNLPLITPPDTTVKIVKLEEELKEGNIAILKIKKGILPFVWELVFEKVDAPNLIVDVATRSPFKTFRHEHHFIEVNGKNSILRDKVTFSLPLEPLSAMAVWFVKRDLQKMFTYRHNKTKEAIASLEF
ncbi:MAG: Unknown protein [uncultured Sulfurovum sp.]|uniref:Coenzyme Q-binding protein COQ10 START domain-containing protein n=1 Tax=uncultured Sulfurovum sp. TaxID=269237 RepID=A0A6S6TZ67_9BACT|nr:MAG: Unknown protein [uncultured Sulfurovum sp.]